MEREILESGWPLSGAGAAPEAPWVRPCWRVDVPGLGELVDRFPAGPDSLPTGIDQQRTLALAAFVPTGRTIAVGIGSPHGDGIRVQFAVAEGWQDRGLESALLAELARRAALFDVKRLIGVVPASTAKVLRKHGADELPLREQDRAAPGSTVILIDTADAIHITNARAWEIIAAHHPTASISERVRLHAYHVVMASMVHVRGDLDTALCTFAEIMGPPLAKDRAYLTEGMPRNAVNESVEGALMRRAIWLTDPLGL